RTILRTDPGAERRFETADAALDPVTVALEKCAYGPERMTLLIGELGVGVDVAREPNELGRLGRGQSRPVAVYWLLQPFPCSPAAVASRKYYTITELNEAKLKELVEIGKEFSVEGASGLGQQDLITRILQAQTEAQGHIFAQGILEIVEDGFGFLRRRSLLPSPEDVYVGSSQVRRLGLRTGDFVTGATRPPKDSEKYFSLLRVA